MTNGFTPLTPVSGVTEDQLLFYNLAPMKLKSVAILIGMLCTTSALAMSYTIRPNYESDMCRAVRRAFTEGLVLDATQPLCERRFSLSPKGGGSWFI